MDLSSSFNAGEFFNALKNNDAEKITYMLRGIEKEELKLLLLSEVEQTANDSKPCVFGGGCAINLEYLSAGMAEITLVELKLNFNCIMSN